LRKERGEKLEPIALAREIVNILEDKFAEEIIVLDLRGLSDFTDSFVIATASSERLLDNLSAVVKEDIKKVHNYNAVVEGSGQTGWIILDYGYVVVHLLSSELREYYKLETLWHDAKVVLSVQ
jgi:ribosome-associated protein